MRFSFPSNIMDIQVVAPIDKRFRVERVTRERIDMTEVWVFTYKTRRGSIELAMGCDSGMLFMFAGHDVREVHRVCGGIPDTNEIFSRLKRKNRRSRLTVKPLRNPFADQ